MYSRLALFFSALFFLFLAMACGEPGTPAARPTNGTSPTGPGGNGTGTGGGTGPSSGLGTGSGTGGGTGPGSGLGTGSGTGGGTGPGIGLGTGSGTGGGTGLGSGKPSSAAPFKKITGSAGLGTTGGGGPVKKITTGGLGGGGLGGKIPATGVASISVLPPIVAKYIDTYVTKYDAPDVAPLDIAEGPLSKGNVFGDARCRDFFGVPPTESIPDTLPSEQSVAFRTAFDEYMAGQVLMALGFRTTMKCFYLNERNELRGMYRPARTLPERIKNAVDLSRNKPANGGVEIHLLPSNTIVYLQPSFQYLFPRLNKWLVADPEAGLDDLIYLSGDGLLTTYARLAYVAKQLTQSFTHYFKDEPWKDGTSTDYIDGLMTDEMLLGFIKQMKDVIATDKGGTSVLSHIFSGPIGENAVQDFAKAGGFNPINIRSNAKNLENTFKDRINKLITHFETRLKKVDKNLWINFDKREAIREKLITDVEANIRNNIGFDRKAFRIALLGKNYIDNPSDQSSLEALDAVSLALIEQTRLIDILNAKKEIVSISEKPTITFSYPATKKYLIAKESTDVNSDKAVKVAVDYIKKNLPGFSLKEEIELTIIDPTTASLKPAKQKRIENPDLITKVNEAIDQDCTLFVVGFDSGWRFFRKSKSLNKIFAEYENKGRLDLPRFIVSVLKRSEAKNVSIHLGSTRLQPRYKDESDNTIFMPPVTQYDGISPETLGFADGFAVPLDDGSDIKLSADGKDFANIDSLLDFIKTNYK